MVELTGSWLTRSLFGLLLTATNEKHTMQSKINWSQLLSLFRLPGGTSGPKQELRWVKGECGCMCWLRTGAGGAQGSKSEAYGEKKNQPSGSSVTVKTS